MKTEEELLKMGKTIDAVALALWSDIAERPSAERIAIASILMHKAISSHDGKDDKFAILQATTQATFFLLMLEEASGGTK